LQAPRAERLYFAHSFPYIRRKGAGKFSTRHGADQMGYKVAVIGATGNVGREML